MKKFVVSIKGGAVRGFGSIGAIRFLQEENLHPTIIAGASAGSLVATAYAFGLGWEEMTDLIQEINVRKLLSLRNLLRKGYLIEDEEIYDLLKLNFEDKNIEDLPVKLLIYA